MVNCMVMEMCSQWHNTNTLRGIYRCLAAVVFFFSFCMHPTPNIAYMHRAYAVVNWKSEFRTLRACVHGYRQTETDLLHCHTLSMHFICAIFHLVYSHRLSHTHIAWEMVSGENTNKICLPLLQIILADRVMIYFILMHWIIMHTWPFYHFFFLCVVSVENNQYKNYRSMIEVRAT